MIAAVESRLQKSFDPEDIEKGALIGKIVDDDYAKIRKVSTHPPPITGIFRQISNCTVRIHKTELNPKWPKTRLNSAKSKQQMT